MTTDRDRFLAPSWEIEDDALEAMRRELQLLFEEELDGRGQPRWRQALRVEQGGAFDAAIPPSGGAGREPRNTPRSWTLPRFA
jgi:hypothetical protein